MAPEEPIESEENVAEEEVVETGEEEPEGTVGDMELHGG